MIDFTDPRAIAAYVSIAVSIPTVLLTSYIKSLFGRRDLIHRLENEHRYEQIKQIKAVLAKHKSGLIDSAERLNHRLWNFSVNYGHDWHVLKKNSSLADSYYLGSFVHRLAAFFCWVNRTDIEIGFLDTTIASDDDLQFVKFLRIMPQVMCDVVLFKGIAYDNSEATDHFFRDQFDQMMGQLWDAERNQVTLFDDFLAEPELCEVVLNPVVTFIEGMSPSEPRLRWERIQALHIVVMMFLNRFGYKFQYTDIKQIRSLKTEGVGPIRVVDNLKLMLSRVDLDTDSEVKKILSVLQG